MRLIDVSSKTLQRAAKIRLQIDKLETRLAKLINGTSNNGGPAKRAAKPKKSRKRRRMSAAARAKISAAQKKRWKAQKVAPTA